ncbi:MAG: thiamine phosphate synthase [Bryobacteraceae bacterium]|nr:thiamine phosphate synthase [Bryobacteraceae bacterium]
MPVFGAPCPVDRYDENTADIMILPRLYPILDTGTLERRRCPVETAAQALADAGVRILQFRHKGHLSRAVFEQTERVAALCRERGTLFVINDRTDLAMVFGAGLHLGQNDLPPAEARRLLGPGAVLGFSTHNEAQLRAAAGEPVDYVALGPIFGTATKEKPDPVVGLAELVRLRPISSRPLVAIGGITRQNARSVLEAGADSVAVIADLYPEPCTYDTLRARTVEWLELLNR